MEQINTSPPCPSISSVHLHGCSANITPTDVCIMGCEEAHAQNLTSSLPASMLSISIILSSMQQFPGHFANLSELQILDLKSNNMMSLNAIPAPFEKLKKLDLCHNKISYIEPGFFYLNFFELVTLNLCHNHLKTVDLEFLMIMFSLCFETSVNIDLSNNVIIKGTAYIMDERSNISNNGVFLSRQRSSNVYGCIQSDSFRMILSYNKITQMSDILFGWNLQFIPDYWYLPRTAILDDLMALEKAISFDGNPLLLNCLDCIFYRYKTPKFINSLNKTWMIEKYYMYDILPPLTGSINEIGEMWCNHKDSDCPHNCNCNFIGCAFVLKVHCSNRSNIPLNLPTYGTTEISNEIHLEHNNITHVPFETYLYSVTYFDLNNNNVQRIDAEALQSISLKVEVLFLYGNQLTYLPEVNEWPKLQYLSLYDNPWHCDCKIQWMKPWILQFGIKYDKTKGTVCASPFYNAGHSLSTLPNWRFICLSTIVGITVSVVMVFTTIVSSVLFYKWRFWLYQKYGFHPFDKDECDNEDKKFDVFVSYSNDDYEWARELMAELENLGFRVCCHEGDFLAGTTISENVARAVHFSKRTLCIVSRAFMASSICMHEFITARSFDFSYKKARLLVIMYDDMATDDLHEDIKMYVKSFTYLKRDCPFFMKRLLYRLPQKKLGNDENTPLLLDTHV